MKGLTIVVISLGHLAELTSNSSSLYRVGQTEGPDDTNDNIVS